LRDFDGLTRVILEASDPEAHAEFDRVVKHRPRDWYIVRRATGVMREHPRSEPHR
jgi:hypothetical protein